MQSGDNRLSALARVFIARSILSIRVLSDLPDIVIYESNILLLFDQLQFRARGTSKQHTKVQSLTLNFFVHKMGIGLPLTQ
jgi:hypothetical protein